MSLAALHDHEVRRMRDLGHPLAQAELIKRGLAEAPRNQPIQAREYSTEPTYIPGNYRRKFVR